MYHNTEKGGSPFELKIKGDFGRALTAYARHYIESLRRENYYIADVCLDQMFDVCLLERLKEGQRFETKRKLLEDIERRLANVLRHEEADYVGFKERLAKCNRKLFPRGRSPGVFSVDPKWLLRPVSAQPEG